MRFLNKLCARMQKLRWPVEDQVCRDGLRARDAVQDLATFGGDERPLNSGDLGLSNEIVQFPD